jgi:hypothetical protein
MAHSLFVGTSLYHRWALFEDSTDRNGNPRVAIVAALTPVKTKDLWDGAAGDDGDEAGLNSSEESESSSKESAESECEEGDDTSFACEACGDSSKDRALSPF